MVSFLHILNSINFSVCYTNVTKTKNGLPKKNNNLANSCEFKKNRNSLKGIQKLRIYHGHAIHEVIEVKSGHFCKPKCYLEPSEQKI